MTSTPLQALAASTVSSGVANVRHETPVCRRWLAAGLAAMPALAACNPTVRVEAPTEPIEINLNIRIEQEVRIKIDRELDELFTEKDDIF